MSLLQDMVGKVFTRIYGDVGDGLLVFANDEEEYVFHHEQDCCERVSIEDITGQLSDLIGRPLLLAEESTNRDNPPPEADYFLWTFYKFATIKGYVDVRWLGESNGYYSEGVSLLHRTKT